jgi:hypothetical protein
MRWQEVMTVDSKKWIFEEYLNEKLTLQVLWLLGVAQQSLVGVMIVPKVAAHSVLVMAVRSTKLRVGLALEAVKYNKKLGY